VHIEQLKVVDEVSPMELEDDGLDLPVRAYPCYYIDDHDQASPGIVVSAVKSSALLPPTNRGAALVQPSSTPLGAAHQLLPQLPKTGGELKQHAGLMSWKKKLAAGSSSAAKDARRVCSHCVTELIC
jgi:hypothetical protein